MLKMKHGVGHRIYIWIYERYILSSEKLIISGKLLFDFTSCEARFSVFLSLCVLVQVAGMVHHGRTYHAIAVNVTPSSDKQASYCRNISSCCPSASFSSTNFTHCLRLELLIASSSEPLTANLAIS